MLAIQVEPYGFDEQVWLITQPRGQFRDYKYQGITNIYKGFFHRKYYFPAEYDVLVSFMPTRALNGLTSPMGQFKMRVMLQGPLTEEQLNDPDAKVLDRPQQEDSSSSDTTVPNQNQDQQSQDQTDSGDNTDQTNEDQSNTDESNTEEKTPEESEPQENNTEESNKDETNNDETNTEQQDQQ